MTFVPPTPALNTKGLALGLISKILPPVLLNQLILTIAEIPPIAGTVKVPLLFVLAGTVIFILQLLPGP